MRFIKLMCIILSMFLLCACAANKNSTASQADQTSFPLESNSLTLVTNEPSYLTEPSEHEIIERLFFSEDDKPWINPKYDHTQDCVLDQIAAKEIATLVVDLLLESSLKYDPNTVKLYESAKVWVVSFKNSSSVENPFLMIAIKQENAQILNIWSSQSDSTQSNAQKPWEKSDGTIPIPILPDKETAGTVSEIIQRAYVRNDDYYPRAMIAQMAWYVQEEGYWVIYIHEDVHYPTSNTMTITFDEKDWRVVKKWVWT